MPKNTKPGAERKAAMLSLFERGFELLPVRSGDSKEPDSLFIAHGFEDATADAELFTTWLNMRPTLNVGVRCGQDVGIVVVDVDVKNGKPGKETAQKIGLGSIFTLICDTPSGGFHSYFKHPGIPLVGTLPGIDIKGGAAGAYVLAPPSVLSNGVYRWRDPEMPIAEMPPELLEVLRAGASSTTDNNTAKGDGPTVDRSADLLSVVADAVRAGKSDDEIHHLHDHHPHAVDQSNPKRAVQRCIDKARQDQPKANGHDAHPWMPPAVVSYGASFNPAAIPLRQWLIRGRYARGEGTALVGPPGTNKSSLLLADAVALATGRSLLGDTIDQSGGVLLLVGEDRKRDVEARIAALCVQYQLQPAELREQLHVVYQSAIDPAKYSLAAMVRDIATLNTSMIEWLRKYPGLVALFVDPMASWHRLFENDNNAMTMLCLALRSIAEQSNIGVAFDHHVNKASMADPEAHVQNLSSLRGSSSIAADMRWGFTLARLRPETALQFGIPEEDRRLFRRMDSLKASYGPDDETLRLLKVSTVQIANGEHVGVLTTVDIGQLRSAGLELKEAADKRRQSAIAGALGRMLLNKRPRTGADAARWIATHEADLFVDEKGAPLSDRSVRRKLEGTVGAGIPWKHSGGDVSIIVRVTGEGNGTRQEFDFDDAHSTSGQGSGQ